MLPPRYNVLIRRFDIWIRLDYNYLTHLFWIFELVFRVVYFT